MADPVVGDYYLGATPAAPTDLAGDHAQEMLTYLPTYYDESIHVREVLQVEGYELDFIWYLAQDVMAVLTLPNNCPEWALAMWEAVLRLPGRETWATADRRASVLARVGEVVQDTGRKAFIAAEARCATGALTFVYHATANQVDVTTAGLTSGQNDVVKAISLLTFPAHLTITVNGTTIR